MPRRIANSTLNASTIDILNTIRANASYEYQSMVPEITTATEIPRVGEVLFGYPALANQFINSLVNRIATVVVRSATFNNNFADLKKGYLEFGETVEEVFVNIAKAREFSADKASQREFKRTLPDVRTAFHTMNWRVQYPVTIQDEDLRTAFLSMDGVQNLIGKIIDSVYIANEYDEYLLFKYLMIKGITSGKMHPVSIGSGDMLEAGVAFRGLSNQLTFMSKKYNASSVTTATPKKDQFIFMDSEFNAKYDVNVLAGAFNMDKAEYIGKMKLVDDWTTFDNDRFSEIVNNSDMVEEVTSAELALMTKVKAVLVDAEWFQVYDNQNKFTEQYVASGMYWNYFYNVWKTVSFSPFSNAIVFVTNDATITTPASFTATVSEVAESDVATILNLNVSESVALVGGNVEFVQTQTATTAGVAIHKYGSVMYPANVSTALTLVATIGDDTYNAGATISPATEVGTTLTFTKQ